MAERIDSKLFSTIISPLPQPEPRSNLYLFKVIDPRTMRERMIVLGEPGDSAVQILAARRRRQYC